MIKIFKMWKSILFVISIFIYWNLFEFLGLLFGDFLKRTLDLAMRENLAV